MNVGGGGFDDGGVGDLKLAIDLDDHVLRRKRGETNFVMAVQTDSLPRMREGRFKDIYRRDQKVQLAQILFSEDSAGDSDLAQNPTKTSEAYTEQRNDRDEETKQKLLDSLRSAKFALRLSLVLREPACICLSLAEISKRYLTYSGKEGAEDAYRCAMKGIEIATSEFYDVDQIVIEVSRLFGGLCSVVKTMFSSTRIVVVLGRGKARDQEPRKGPDIPWSCKQEFAAVYASTRVRYMPEVGLSALWKRSFCDGQGRGSTGDLRKGDSHPCS